MLKLLFQSTSIFAVNNSSFLKELLANKYQLLNKKQRLFVFDKQALAADITCLPDPAHSYKILTKMGTASRFEKEITKMGAFNFSKVDAKLFSVGFKSPHFWKMKLTKVGSKLRLISVDAFYNFLHNFIMHSDAKLIQQYRNVSYK